MHSETDRGDDLGATTLSADDSAVNATATGLPTGARLGRYVVLSVVGAGGMGVVYLAYDPKLDRRVAVKLLHHSSSGQRKKEGGVRLLREAQATARVQHRNVITVHDVGQHDDSVFVAMEFVEGRTLREWIAQGQSRTDIVAMFLEAGAGLDAAHREGLVHRDFKPDNVMVADDGRVIVMDFGLARAEESGSFESRDSGGIIDTSLTKTGAVLGTPAYMAPEQHTGDPLDARSDQFSFCIALYEALYGERPFCGRTLPELVDNLASGEVRPPPAKSDVPTWLRSVLLVGLAAAPDQRHRNMSTLLKALRHDPTRRRRWVIATAGIATLALGIGGWSWGVERKRVADCERDANAVYADWNDGARDTMRSAFEAAGMLAGADAWEHAEPHLHAAADSLAATREELCKSAGRSPTEIDRRRFTCLDRRAAAFESLLENFRTADSAVVRRSVVAAANLRPAHLCADDRFARRYPPQRPDEAGAQLRAEFNRLVARSKSERAVTRYEQARATAEEALAIAARLEDVQAEATARDALAAVHMSLGKPEEAERAFEEAYFLSRDNGDDEAAASSAVNLVRVVGYQLGRPQEGLRWGRHARTLLRQQGAEGTERWASLHRRLGSVHARGGDYDKALEAAEVAVQIYRDQLGEQNPKTGTALNDLGVVYAQKGDIGAALETFTQALRVTEAALGPRHPDVASAHENLANTLSMTGRGDEALEHLQRVLDLRRALFGDKHLQVAGALFNMASALGAAKRPEDAIPLIEQAIEIRAAGLPAEHPDNALCRLLLAQTLNALGSHDRALSEGRRARDGLQRAYDAEHPHVGMALGEIAQALKAQGDTTGAREAYDEAIGILEPKLGANDPHVVEFRDEREG